MGECLTRTPTLVTAATWEPVTLAQAKRHVQVTPDDHQFDGELTALITAAREQFEYDTQLICASSTWSLKYDEWPDEDDGFPLRPVTSIDWVKYYDTSGTLQTLGTSVYQLDTSIVPPTVVLKYNQSWPSWRGWYGDIEMQFVAGYASQSAVPGRIVQTILLLIGHWFDQRNAASTTEHKEVPLSYSHLIRGLQRSSYP